MNCFKCNNKIPINIGWSSHYFQYTKKCEFKYFIHSNILGGICYIDPKSFFSYCIFKTNLLKYFNTINILNIQNEYVNLNYEIDPITDNEEAYNFLIKTINRHKDNSIFE